MSDTGYCTVEDVRQALQETVADFDSGAWGEANNAVVVKAITSQTEWLEKSLKRHWYAPTGADILDEASAVDIPTATKTRDDEYSIPTGGATLVGEPATPKTAQGDYAAIGLARRDGDSVEALHVRQGDGTYEDWVASSDYSEGSWPPAADVDYYLRVNNGGWTRLYVDTTNLLEEDEDDEYVLDSFANAVYLEWSYGHEGIPQTVRRAVAMRAAAQLLAPDDEASLGIPENATLQAVETKVGALERQAKELLEEYR